MSAPEPKAWEATEDELAALICQLEPDEMDCWNAVGAREIIESVARRRAIEELKALVVVVCEPCEEVEPRVLCRCGCNRVRHASGRDCMATDILDRIAAIEAEEA